jgi:hypothetical protein
MSAAPTQDRLAVATSSPHIHFLSISPYSIYLEPSSPVTRTEAIQGRTRTLSIAWGPPTRVHLQSGGPAETDGKSWVWRNHYLVTGNSDSSLRKWNVLNGRMIGRMAVNKLSWREYLPFLVLGALLIPGLSQRSHHRLLGLARISYILGRKVTSTIADLPGTCSGCPLFDDWTREP